MRESLSEYCFSDIPQWVVRLRGDLCWAYTPPFNPTMERLRCQAKVGAKTLKLHTPGCCTHGCPQHQVCCGQHNQYVALFPGEFFLNTKVSIPECSASFLLCYAGCSSANIFTPLFAGHLVLHGSVLLFPHQLLWGFSFYRPKIASSRISTREDQTEPSVSLLATSLPLTGSLSIR